ncbi:MAG: sigma-70 family RNA polymerase sigma factor, partial [Planctomycetes bacterium]|nr:sigma-70 family RNA polymerase sigma factor [Planctomycetota bacterium]
MNDETIISGCRRRDRDAQRQLYERHAERIYRTVLRMVRDRDAAFDVTQETFVRAFQKIGSFDGRAAIGTWLYRIATNEALQFLRKRETE